MGHTKKIKSILGTMATLSALGLAVELAVAASTSSSIQKFLLVLPVVFSSVLVIMGVRLFLLSNNLPAGETLRQNTFACLVVLGVQAGYCLLILTGEVELHPVNFGNIFAFLGYFSVFRLVYDSNKKKPDADSTPENSSHFL